MISLIGHVLGYLSRLDSGDPAISSIQEAFQAGMGRGQFRTWAQIRALFDGLELVDPGLVLVPDWRPDPSTPSASDFPVLRLACAAVARTPRALAHGGP